MKKMVKIYDCFMLFDEIDLLSIRLEELYNFVDYFLIVEANTNYLGIAKPLYFEKYKSRFEKFKDKIIYLPVSHPRFSLLDKFYMWLNKKTKHNLITVAGFLFGLGIWKMERFQRTCIKKGLKNCSKSDIILLSDLDEIPNTDIFPLIKKTCEKNKLVWLKQKDYRYFLNGELKDFWLGTKAIKFDILKKYYFGNPAEIRYGFIFALRKKFSLKPEIIYLERGGWHFSYLGGIKKVMEKIKFFSTMNLYRSEKKDNNLENKKNLKKCLEEGILVWEKNKKLNYVKIDKTFPKTIYENQKKFNRLIKKVK